ncbi:UNVERIFIED_CONTAM: HAE1 family hydrophobic/amphiphilic exporter-1 [Brevibacillus sp. OAP136]
MSFSSFSIRRPITIMMLAIAVLIFGFISLPKLAVDLYPELNFPVAIVVTSVDGGTPSEVEKLVTKPIEESVGTVANIKRVTSNSAEGASQVIVEFNWGVDMDQATLNLRDKVDQVRGALPDSAKSPRILRLDPNSMPIITLAVTGESDIVKLKALVENVMKPRLERIDGVASVGISGGKTREVEVELDPNRIAAYGLTLDQIQQAVMSTNISGAAGVIRQGDAKINIRLQSEFKDVAQIGETPIHVGQGSIQLKNIATVSDTFKEVTQKAYLDGMPSVGLNILKASGGNTISVADQVKAKLAELQAELPANIKVTTTLDTSTFIKDSIYTVGEHALVGGLFSILVLLCFLNSYRSMIIIAIVIPISVIATFCLMYFTGQTINMFSLSGLTLGLGSLVDFAVVILENIFRHREEGKSMWEAADIGAREVSTAVMASALAQISVFLPIVFVEGLASQLFGPLALTVVFSHLAALIASMALVPMLSARWLKRLPNTAIYESGTYRGINPIVWFNVGFHKVTKGYGRLLRWSVGHRKTVFFITIAMFIATIPLAGMVGAEFIPKLDQGKISVNIKLPNGSMLKETEAIVTQVESFAKKVPELEQLYTSIGSAGGNTVVAQAATNEAQLTISVGDKEKRKRTTLEIVEDLRKQVAHIAGAEITVKELDNSGGPPTAPLEISLRGDDMAVLEDISSIIAEEVKQVQGTRNVTTSLTSKQNELQLVVDLQKAGTYGLSSQQILSSVRTAFQGQTITKYRTGDDEVDVNMRLPEAYKDDISYLEQLRIPTPSGAQISLSSVAKIVEENVPQLIKRVNQTREVTITSDIVDRDLNSISADLQKRLAGLRLPDGYTIEYGGQSKDMAEAFGSLGLAIVLSIVLVYMVMASQFESLFAPFIIMFSIPPTFIGVVIGLLVTGISLSVSAFIGYILLIGIVVNNAIVLIDYINTLRKKGVERNEAIFTAGPVRLRPILMTTLATILAILPLAFGGGAGNESQAPMAVVVTFGLSFSTLITLILIPVVYTWFDDLGNKFRNRRNKRKAKKKPGITSDLAVE